MEKFQAAVNTELIASQNTPEKISEREKAKQEKISKIQALQGNMYYNAKYEPFALKLAYISDKEPAVKYAEFTATSLKELGIKAEMMPLETKSIDAMIKTQEKNYDMIIVGIRSPGVIADM